MVPKRKKERVRRRIELKQRLAGSRAELCESLDALGESLSLVRGLKKRTATAAKWKTAATSAAVGWIGSKVLLGKSPRSSQSGPAKVSRQGGISGRLARIARQEITRSLRRAATKQALRLLRSRMG